jgi:hypothetical protein
MSFFQRTKNVTEDAGNNFGREEKDIKFKLNSCLTKKLALQHPTNVKREKLTPHFGLMKTIVKIFVLIVICLK